MAVAKMTPNQLDVALKDFPVWKLNAQGQIEQTFELKDFAQALLFVNAVGFIAEQQNHHPDILILWNKVRISVSTHDADGITQLDFNLAKAIQTILLESKH
jgi:4a-hydroxytetrahydrobiopterin dehydratase